MSGECDFARLGSILMLARRASESRARENGLRGLMNEGW